MKYQELQTKTVSELYDLLIAQKKELLGLRIKQKLGQLDTPSLFKQSKKLVAQIMTRIHQLKCSKGEK